MFTSLLLLSLMPAVSMAQRCLSDPELNDIFVELNEAESIPTEGSCCQFDVCGIPCPEPVSDPGVGYGIAVAIAIAISFFIGLATYFVVKGEAENYFVAGKSLPLWIVAMTLGAQSVDSNALLGNADLSYKYHFYDGAVIPIGLGLSLILNGIFLAAHINREVNILTLPDVHAKRYGKVVEILIGLCTLCSFIMLLAGNLVGMGVITSYLWGTSETLGIWIAAIIVWCYTVSGGLFSVAYTDVVQGMVGWTGCAVCAYWLIATQPGAPPPSIGFPNYIYPNQEICDMYEGGPCGNDTSLCCYNEAKWCDENGDCVTDNGAYPIGDQRVFQDQMSNAVALTPFPNAIFWNWCTIFILGFGNLGALDFQARCMAAKTPNTARYGCLIAACFTFFIGIPYAYLGAITRVHYGPDSVHAEFDTDTCSTILGLPTCGAWVPDTVAFVKLLTHEAQPFIGGWCLVGIVAASMSTADGAILAMGTVFSHNLMRQLDAKFPKLITAENLLFMARLSTIPFTLASAFIGTFYRSSDSAAGATGYLLIVAFDIVLATVVPPLFGCFYVKNPSPRAALCSVCVGLILRITLEFALSKDGLLLLPYDVPEFYDYGSAASADLPTFVYSPNPDDIWDPNSEVCVQEQFRDFTGVDSISAFVGAIIFFVSVQLLEKHRGKALFSGPWLEGYEKDLGNDDEDDELKHVEDTEGTGFDKEISEQVLKPEPKSVDEDEKSSTKEKEVVKVKKPEHGEMEGSIRLDL